MTSLAKFHFCHSILPNTNSSIAGEGINNGSFEIKKKQGRPESAPSLWLKIIRDVFIFSWLNLIYRKNTAISFFDSNSLRWRVNFDRKIHLVVRWNFARVFSDFLKSYNATRTGRFKWTQILDASPDDKLYDGIDDNGEGDSPDDDLLVSLQTTFEQIFWIYSYNIKWGVSII